MPWPTSLAYKVTAEFFQQVYGESARRLLLEDLPIEAMTFFNPNATAEARRATALNVATDLVKHMNELSIPLETDGNESDATKALSAVMSDGDSPSEKIGAVIDANFRFVDEEKDENNGEKEMDESEREEGHEKDQVTEEDRVANEETAQSEAWTAISGDTAIGHQGNELFQSLIEDIEVMYAYSRRVGLSLPRELVQKISRLVAIADSEQERG